MKKLIVVLILVCFAFSAKTQSLDSLNHKLYLDYLNGYKGNGFKVENEATWNKAQGIFSKSPGTYLIKARNQMLTGIALSMTAGIVAGIKPDREGFICAGALSLLGFGFEISGICKIGKAGIVMNKNGVGIEVKF